MAKVTIKIPEAYADLFKPARMKCFHGGRGGAKSESVGRYLLTEGIREPMNIVCGREFQSSIKESVHSMLAYLIEIEGLSGEYEVKETEICGRNGTRFTFVGVRKNINNIKSMHNIKKFWGEEAHVFSKNSLDVLFPTIRAEDSELIFTMNPELEEDPAYQMLVLHPPPDSIVKQVNYWDNPYFPDVLRKEMEYMKEHDYQNYLHIWEGQCKQAVEGAIFAKELSAAAKENRITSIPYDPTVPVCTYWDLGKSALTAIWFCQYVGMQWRVLRHYSNSMEDLNHYLKYVQSLPYVYEKHYLPHDGEQKRLGMVLNIKEQAQKVLKNVQIVPRIPHKVDAINAAKQIFPLCYFDRELCSDGLSDLRHYAYRVTEEGKISNEPEEGTTYRDTADAFMTFAQSCRPPKIEEEKPTRYKVPQSTAWWK